MSGSGPERDEPGADLADGAAVVFAEVGDRLVIGNEHQVSRVTKTRTMAQCLLVQLTNVIRPTVNLTFSLDREAEAPAASEAGIREARSFLVPLDLLILRGVMPSSKLGSRYRPAAFRFGAWPVIGVIRKVRVVALRSFSSICWRRKSHKRWELKAWPFDR
jgi:hypothetical protein